MNTFKNFIKQYFFMLALVGIAAGFSAFKYASKSTEMAPLWYEVDQIGGENQIGGLYNGTGTPPPSGGDCKTSQTLDQICAVQYDASDHPNVQTIEDLEDEEDAEFALAWRSEP